MKKNYFNSPSPLAYCFKAFVVIALMVSGFISEGMAQACTCEGKIVSMTFEYNPAGVANVSIYVYADKNQTQLLQTFSNVQPGDVLTASAIEGGLDRFKAKTYFVSSANLANATEIHTSCSEILTGNTYGEYYFLSQTDFAGTTCSVGSFPVEWLSFEAIQNQGDAILTWVTANEQNSDRFEVERSFDNASYEVAGTLAAAGNSTENRAYTFTDRGIGSKNNQAIYYRLKQIDFDGEFEYSDVVELKVKVVSSIDISIFPNPVVDQATIAMFSPEPNSQVRILNSRGQEVYHHTFSEMNQPHEITVFTKDWTPGIYYLQFNSVTSQKSRAFLVQ